MPAWRRQLLLAWNHLLGGICRGASFARPGAFSPFTRFAVLSLAEILALMMVFPDLFFRRPLATRSTATMRDFSIVISCLLGQRFANGADDVRERRFLAMAASARQSEPWEGGATICFFAFSRKIKASFAAPGPRSQIRDLGWRLPYSGYHLYDPSRRQPSGPLACWWTRGATGTEWISATRVRVRRPVTTPRPRDRARRPASSDGRCRPFVAPRVPSVSGPQDSVRPR